MVPWRRKPASPGGWLRWRSGGNRWGSSDHGRTYRERSGSHGSHHATDSGCRSARYDHWYGHNAATWCYSFRSRDCCHGQATPDAYRHIAGRRNHATATPDVHGCIASHNNRAEPAADIYRSVAGCHGYSLSTHDLHRDLPCCSGHPKSADKLYRHVSCAHPDTANHASATKWSNSGPNHSAVHTADHHGHATSNDYRASEPTDHDNGLWSCSDGNQSSSCASFGAKA